MKIYPGIKIFLKNHLYLLDEHKEDDFLDLLWEEQMNSAEVKDIFYMLDKVNSPITKEMRINHFIDTVNQLLREIVDIEPEDWRDNYYYIYPIDREGDINLYALMQGFRLHSYGFDSKELSKIIDENRYKFNTAGDIYIR